MTVEFTVIPKQSKGRALLINKKKWEDKNVACFWDVNVYFKEWKIHNLGLQLNTIKAFTSVDHGPL